jgi:hypothetical protein
VQEDDGAFAETCQLMSRAWAQIASGSEPSFPAQSW